MKNTVWIDKQGGMHYHKEGCRAIQGDTYEPILLQRIPKGDTFMFGKYWRRCPFCWPRGVNTR